MQRVQSGDRLAFGQLVERHANRFYRVAYNLMKNKDDSEDMVQTAFLKFWQRPYLYEAKKKTRFTTWFHRVVTNLCLDQIKRKGPQDLSPETFPQGEGPPPEEALEGRRRQEVLEKLLKELPERQRIALELCFYQGFSNQEAADILGVKSKALQSLLMRAKKTLREKVSQLEGEINK